MKRKMWAFLAVSLVTLLLSAAAQAQILLVNSDYRITYVDKAEQRVGICLLDANPNTRQNWLYIKVQTQLFERITREDGSFKDEAVTWSDFFDSLEKGAVIRVNGGRDWDKSIDAKKVLLLQRGPSLK